MRGAENALAIEPPVGRSGPSVEHTKKDLVITDELVAEHQAYLYKVVIKMLNRYKQQLGVHVEELARDVVQETWRDAIRAQAGFRGAANVRTWLTSIALNQARHKLKISRRHPEYLAGPTGNIPTDASHSGDLHDDTDRQERLYVLLGLIEQLPQEEMRKALKLRYGFEGGQEMKAEEVGAIMNKKAATIRPMLSRARALLLARAKKNHIDLRDFL